MNIIRGLAGAARYIFGPARSAPTRTAYLLLLLAALVLCTIALGSIIIPWWQVKSETCNPMNWETTFPGSVKKLFWLPQWIFAILLTMFIHRMLLAKIAATLPSRMRTNFSAVAMLLVSLMLSFAAAWTCVFSCYAVMTAIWGYFAPEAYAEYSHCEGASGYYSPRFSDKIFWRSWFAITSLMAAALPGLIKS